MNKIREWISIKIAKSPGPMVILGIFLANIVIFSIAAIIISQLAPSSLEHDDFQSCVFYTILMILDAGCIQFVVQDIGEVGVFLILVCLFTVIVGMISFTGAIIGYMSNLISQFIENSNSGSRKLKMTDHTVILNWNSRASEIVNDLLYKGVKEKIVVLVGNDKENVIKDISERLSDTLEKERKVVRAACADMSFFARIKYINKHRIKNKLVVIVREGETYSTKQLNDISLSMAKSVIILGDDISNTLCKFDYKERITRLEKGNANTIKTLVQVAQITAAEDSADNQQIIVVVDDDWTLSLVNRIIRHKMRKGKCNITPVAVNRVLGQILSQFSIMPELNMVYSTLFSNKDAAFYTRPVASMKSETDFIEKSLANHPYAVPLTVMSDNDGKKHIYYMAGHESHIRKQEPVRRDSEYRVLLNPNFDIKEKNVVILGHNSKSTAIMEGFNSFRSEWQKLNCPEILNVIVIDDAKNLEKQNYYKQYPYVKKVISADVFEKDVICNAINEFVDANTENTSVLILSDDTVLNEEIDANALTYLIYVQGIISQRVAQNPDFDVESIDIVVEIMNPKNYDVVHHYSVENIIISNRYISKMVTQIGEKGALFDFYNDILAYDEASATVFASKELYIKKVSEFFAEIPGACTATDFIRAVYEAGPENNKSIALGYVSPGGKMVLFEGHQDNIRVELTENDKLILFSNH
jgi:hypothetical protein